MHLPSHALKLPLRADDLLLQLRNPSAQDRLAASVVGPACIELVASCSTWNS